MLAIVLSVYRCIVFLCRLVFDSLQEAQSWRMAIEDAIAEGLADDSVSLLDKLWHYCSDTLLQWHMYMLLYLVETVIINCTLHSVAHLRVRQPRLRIYICLLLPGDRSFPLTITFPVILTLLWKITPQHCYGKIRQKIEYVCYCPEYVCYCPGTEISLQPLPSLWS